MATYLKRTSKLFDNTLSRTYADVNLRDLMCPVCRGILIEPVTLPCTHNLCLRCLKGTFEHNSLSCPLCRVRVGSWLRAATKSETLVNNGLWELIRTKFAKEVEDKHNGDDGDIELNAGYSSTNKILSAAGEIRREYEIQLQMAEEEIRRQREAEQIASEALIRKLQAEEQEQLAQLAQDQLLAKTLAKKQVIEKQKETTKHCYTSSQPTIEELNFVSGTLTCDAGFVPLNNPESPRTSNLEGKNMNLSQVRENMEVRKSNAALVSKVRAERHASGLKTNSSNAFKDVSVKFCCQKTMPIYNTISRTLKHQTVTKITQPNTSNYLVEPGCSTSKIYGSQSKEELHVPSDVLSSKKKSLGIEVCMTVGEDDERIGSAESAGSHDSINQEIHHFKPIKAMPRTPLKISLDGKQIDPKLIRVIPILKRVYNTVPKPPSPTHLKRRIGCSWSAFRGKVRQDLKLKETLSKQENIETKIEQKPSTSLVQSSPVSHKSTKYQVQDTSHRIELGHEVSIDSNKNYAKNINKVINGTKIGKKSILEESIDSGKIQKSWTSQHKNGMIGKGKRQKNTWSKKSTSHATNRRDEDENDARDSVSSTSSIGVPQESEEQEIFSEKDTAVENIAERIKRRKDPVNKKQKIPEHEPEDTAKRNRKRILSAKVKNLVSNTDSNELEAENKTEYTPRIKRKRTCRTSQRIVENNANESYKPELRKSTRNVRLRSNVTKTSEEQESIDKRIDDVKYDCSPSRVCINEKDECMSENNNSELRISNKNGLSDEEIIKEQERIERLVLQEKEDFELAQRLQAKFDEMERIAGRTRRSRKAIESGNIELDLYKVDVKRTVCASPNGACTAKQSIVNQTMSSETKQRGRPRKRVK